MRARFIPILALGSLIASLSDAQSRVPGVIFLQYLNQNAPQVMCSDAALNQCMDLTQAECITAVQTAAEACQSQLLQSWPQDFEENQENALRYSRDYRQCVYQQLQRTGLVEPVRMNLCQNRN
ncbi:MAG: hypothetical protein LAT65_12950 [Saccharospirillum sp.]|nr:hypothetical protein [Saccharospirillum sp.]